MKTDRARDEITIASIIDEFNMPRKSRIGDYSTVALIAGWSGTPAGCRRIMPYLEAKYGRRLVQEAWRRWKKWWDEEQKAGDRYYEICGDGPLNDGEELSDEHKAADAEYHAALRWARRWLPLDSDPLGDK